MGAGASVNGQRSQDQNQGNRRKNRSVSSPLHSNNNSSGGESSAQNSSADTVSEPSTMKMSCEICSVTFTFFKRKKSCQECHRYFCSNCLPKPPSSSPVGRQCDKCRTLMSGHFTRDDLQGWKIKDMRCFLNVRNISTKDCREKHDLIELILAHFCTKPRQSINDQAKHEDLVRQMAAHVRDVNSVNSSSLPGENSSTQPTHTERPSATATQTNNVPSSSSSSSTSACAQPSSSSSTTAATTTTTSSTPPSSTAVPGPSSSSSSHSSSTEAAGSRVTRNSRGDAAEPPGGEEGGSGGRAEEVVLDRDQLRELLEDKDRIQNLLASHTEEDGEAETEEAAGQPVRRAHLDDLGTEDDIEGLSVRQLKELLVNNFVDFRGCCEKAELVERVRRLWVDYLKNKKKAERIQMEDELEFYEMTEKKPGEQQPSKSSEPPNKGSSPSKTAAPSVSDEAASSSAVTEDNTTSGSNPGPSGETTEEPDSASTSATHVTDTKLPVATTETSAGDATLSRTDDLCHICMDSLVDCILLECGHMVTCTQCGKRLADCPICRQYVVRVVRVFRS